MTPNESRVFAVRFDRTAQVISALTIVLLFAVGVPLHSVLLACLTFAFLFLAYAYSPRAYLVSSRAIIVKRPIGIVEIPLADVREARSAAGEDLNGCIRLWGSGGLFGYYGLFRTSGLGKSTWYVTDRRKCVAIVTAAKTFVLSPDDVDGFLAAVRASAPAPEGLPAAPAFEAIGTARSTGSLAGFVIGACAIALAAAAMFYAPGPPGYTLTPNSLTIHDRFYPVTLSANSVDLPDAKVVDMDRDTQWKPVRKINGFGNAHYRSGLFRVAGGQTVRLYLADGKRLVLLPPKGAGDPVLYQARDPAAFIGQLRREWDGDRRSSLTILNK